MAKFDYKHLFKVGGILCLVGGISALLIGSVNLLTADTISSSELEKENNALKEVFLDENGDIPTDLSVGEKVEISDSNYSKLICYWNIKSSEEDENVDSKYGYVFKCEGSDKNNYGTVSMLVGINVDETIGRISIISNSETYATTLVNEYVDPYNEGERDLEDTKCGATYGATLIKEMAESALSYTKEVLKNGK